MDKFNLCFPIFTKKRNEDYYHQRTKSKPSRKTGA